MLSLYMAATNGDSWRNISEPLELTGGFYYLLFLVYIAFFMFVVQNTLTSLFLEAMMQNADRDTQTIIQEELTRKAAYISKIRRLYTDIDGAGSGELSLEKFCEQLQTPELYAFASSLEIDVTDAEE